MPLKAITPFFTVWRSMVALDREIVDAVVAEEHRGPSAELRAALAEWPGMHYWSRRETPPRLVLVRALRAAPRERWWLHLLLFLVTFVTVWMAGGLLVNAEAAFPSLQAESLAELFGAIRVWVGRTLPALGFAGALMTILLVHELGHYVAAKRYHINTSPPYFLPAPPGFFFIGTFGAFIRLRSPIVDRRQLLDVGAAGPWAGLVVSLAILAVGLSQSELASVAGESHQLIYVGRQPIFIGDSMLMDAMRLLVFGDGTVVLHPLALAGWFGLFVTMLNLLPLGQLDGGHVVYGLVGRHQTKIGMLMWYSLIPLGFAFKGWWIWAALILLLGRGRISHPAVVDSHRPVPRSRWLVGLATAAVFVTTFTADPFPSLW